MSLVFIFLSWSSPFISDDYAHILHSLVLRRLPTIKELFGTGWNDSGATWAYRPILQAIAALEIYSWGYVAGPMRFLNLLLHFFNAFLIYKIAESKKINGQWLIGGIALFLIHPIAWHSIIYVSARSSILVASFVLLSIFFYSKKSGWRFLFLVFAILGVLCKEIGLLACPLALILNWENTQSDFKNLVQKKNWKFFGLFIACVMIMIYIRREMFISFLFTNLSKDFEYEHPWGPYFLAEFKALWIYVRLILFPEGGWSFFHDIHLDEVVIRFSTWIIALLTMISITSGMIFLFIKKKKYFPWAMALLICFLPEMIFPRQLVLNEQRAYLPLVILALSFGFVTISNSIFKYGLILFCLLISWTTFERVKVYGSEESILEHDIENYPGNRFALPMLSDLKLKQGHLEESARLFQKNIDAQMQRKVLGKFEKIELVKSYIQMMRLFIENNQMGLANDYIARCRGSFLISPAYCDWFQVMAWNNEKKFNESLHLIQSVNYSLPMLNLEHFFVLLNLNRDEEALALALQLKTAFVSEESFAKAYIRLLVKKNDLQGAIGLWHYFAEANPVGTGVFTQEFWALENELQKLGNKNP